MGEGSTDCHDPVGSPVHGSDVGMPACASCAHVHAVTDKLGEHAHAIVITYDIGCPECPCRASGTEYRRGVVAAADDAGYNNIATFDGTHNIDDDEYDYDGPRCLPDGHGDAITASRMVPCGYVRRRRLGGLVWFCVSRLVGNLCDQLVEQRRNGRRLGGRPDHGGRTDTAGPTGPDELRGVVSR